MEESAERYDLEDLLRRGVCPLCMTPVNELEPGEFVQNGMHSYCCLQNVSGHTVGACWCCKEMDGLSLREISIEAAKRFRALSPEGE